MNENSHLDNKRKALDFLKLVEARQIDEAYRLYTIPDGKHHNPYYQAGFTALRQGMKEAAVRSPNMQLNVKHVIADGDLVAVHSQVVLSPGEKGIAVVHLFRFQDGKIVEFWDIGQPVPDDSPNHDGMF